MRRNILLIIAPLFLLGFFVWYHHDASATVQDEIAERNRQIEEIQRQIDQYQGRLDELGGTSRTLQNEIATLNARASQIQLEIRKLSLAITQTNQEIHSTESDITDAESKITLQLKTLNTLILALNQADQESLTQILFKNDTISDFFNDVKHIKDTQENISDVVNEIKKLKVGLEDKKVTLEDKRSEYEEIKRFQDSEKRELDSTKKQKNTILAETKGQEKLFQNLVEKSKKDINRIRAQLTYLQQAGITAEDAVKFGQLAAIRTGIRPAYLIAVLEVESGLGRNVGRCNRPDDPPEKSWRVIMHTRDHAPFLAIMSSLGLNPDATAVSCPQFINGKQFGWGGGMGPAQFIPSTWLGYQDEVARLTGRSPANPFIIEDAFIAAGAKLARAGATAKTKPSEIAASKAYYSGNASCAKTPCISYANAIQRKAAEIEQNL